MNSINTSSLLTSLVMPGWPANSWLFRLIKNSAGLIKLSEWPASLKFLQYKPVAIPADEKLNRAYKAVGMAGQSKISSI